MTVLAHELPCRSFHSKSQSWEWVYSGRSRCLGWLPYVTASITIAVPSLTAQEATAKSLPDRFVIYIISYTENNVLFFTCQWCMEQMFCISFFCCVYTVDLQCSVFIVLLASYYWFTSIYLTLFNLVVLLIYLKLTGPTRAVVVVDPCHLWGWSEG